MTGKIWPRGWTEEQANALDQLMAIGTAARLVIDVKALVGDSDKVAAERVLADLKAEAADVWQRVKAYPPG